MYQLCLYAPFSIKYRIKLKTFRHWFNRDAAETKKKKQRKRSWEMKIRLQTEIVNESENVSVDKYARADTHLNLFHIPEFETKCHCIVRENKKNAHTNKHLLHWLKLTCAIFESIFWKLVFVLDSRFQFEWARVIEKISYKGLRLVGRNTRAEKHFVSDRSSTIWFDPLSLAGCWCSLLVPDRTHSERRPYDSIDGNRISTRSSSYVFLFFFR